VKTKAIDLDIGLILKEVETTTSMRALAVTLNTCPSMLQYHLCKQKKLMHIKAQFKMLRVLQKETARNSSMTPPPSLDLLIRP
jgi:hypothetical protein